MRVALVIVVLAGLASAFQPPPSSQLGAVTGRVTESQSGDRPKPIRRALVILKRGQDPGTGVYSDEKGNFHLQVEPGDYTIAVERDGYTAAPRTETKTVNVQAGQTPAEVDLELVRTGVVSGRIVDADGEPLPHASVQLVPASGRKGGPYQGAVTDDRGEYRIFQIPPGRYRLSAAYQAPFQQREIRLQTSDGSPEETYATTYFPGTADAAQASPIDVPAGADLAGFDLQVQRLHAVHIRGRVMGMESAPLPLVILALQPVDPRSGTMRDTVARDAGGRFELSGVLPGKYVLSATAPDLTNQGGGFSAQQAIDVGQADVEGIQLTLAAPQTIKGTVVVPEGRKMPSGLLVLLSSRGRTQRQAGGLGKVGSDASFTFPSVAAGDYDIQLASGGVFDDLYISSIRRGDDDVLARGLHVSGPGGNPVEIVLKPNGGSVEVTVDNSKGEPVPDASVALLPDPPLREQPALNATCMTDARGACTVRGITPAGYHAFAFRKGAGVDLRDPDTIKDFEPYAKAVTVAEGSRQTLQLTVAPYDP